MNKKIEWYQYILKNAIRKLSHKITKKSTWVNSYGGKGILSLEEGNQYMKELLLKEEPFMVCRFGSSELSATVETISYELGISKEINSSMVDIMCQNAGFFPKDEKLIIQYGKLMYEKCGQADLIGVWFNMMEDYVIKNYASNGQISYLRALEPWYSKDPWSKLLEGKKVLVIHPFTNTIERQYEKREFLFPGTDILPEFQLQTVRAIQTIAGQKDERFETWFDALQYMYEEAMKKDFDIAIIGCGAYGFPLAAMLKEAGKQAIHLGGATQLLFGIKGGRWDHHPVIGRLYNEHWTRPDESETPKSFQKIEEGCYW